MLNNSFNCFSLSLSLSLSLLSSNPAPEPIANGDKKYIHSTKENITILASHIGGYSFHSV